MTPYQVFPYAVAALELLACFTYLAYHEWRLAIVWAGVGIANIAFAGIR